MIRPVAPEATPAMSAAAAPRRRVILGFLCLFLLYQSAEGVGQRLLHNFPVQAGLMLACVLMAWPISRWLGFRGMQAYSLSWRAHAMTWLPPFLLLAIGLKAAALYGCQAIGVYAPDPDGMVANAMMLQALPMLLLSTFVPSISEDILTRGFPHRAAGIRWPRATAFVICSSLLYVLNHIYRLSLGPTEWLLLFVYGVTYATALWRTGSLWSAVGLHWGWNLGNELLAQVMPTTTLSADGSRCLSAAAHLLMLAVVWWTTRPGK